MSKRAVALMMLVAVSVCAAPASAKLPPNPSNRRLATELQRILKAKDYKALRAFLSPAFLLQRSDGTYLTKQQYLAKPAVVLSYAVSDIHGTRTGDVRILRFTINSDTLIDGKQVISDNQPRLATFLKVGNTWQMTSNANFTPIPK